MKNLIGNTLSSLAYCAVLTAEKALKSASGKAKKDFAIAFLIQNLPIISFLKPLIAKFLSSAIDSAIELAVSQLKKEKNEQE